MENSPRRKALWIVQEQEGNRTAFALVLAGYGDAWAAVELGRGMGPGHTVFALQPPDDDAAFAKVGTASALADLYLRHLIQRQPEGPYFLGGYSAGALLALEMASRLVAQGREVGLVALLDPLFVRYAGPARVGYVAMERVVRFLLPYAGRSRWFKILSAMIQDPGLERHLMALEGYRPQPYSGRVTLIATRWSWVLRPPGFLADLRRIARGGLDRWRPTGTHHSFMRPPHVGLLGKRLGDWLALYPNHPP